MELSSQKTEENQTTVIKNINDNPDINIESEENKNKNKISKKLIIIMGIAIGLIILSIIVILVVLVNKKEEKHYIIKNYLNNDTDISSDTSKGNETDEVSNIDETDEVSNIDETDKISNSDETDEISKTDKTEKISIDYDSAKKLIDSELIEENHNLLNESLNNINELILMNNNINFSIIQNIVSTNPENLDFLFASNESSLQVAKDDIELYKSRYCNLSQETNAFTKEISDSLNNLSTPLNEFKTEIDNVTKQYEKMIKNLAIPFYLNSNKTNQKLRNLIDDELLDKYKNEIEKFNNFSKSFFDCIDKTAKNIHSSISKVKDNAESLMDKVTTGISEFNENLKNIVKENLHTKLLEIKNSFISFKNDLDKLKPAFNDFKMEIIQLLEEMGKLDWEQNNFIEIINNIKNIINEMGKNSGVIALSNIIIPIFEFKKEKTIMIYIISYFLVSEIEYEVDVMLGIANVEIVTSLDLLFIMDCTGSMSPYIKEAKNNILSIINRIINDCPGIDINLGFIGYRDFYEEYTDINFTQNHSYLKNIINNVYANGGEDLPEDVAFALELALNKNWKSNARMAVFVADAPGHGKNYSDLDEFENYITNVPERFLIEDMVAEMAEKNIALFCYRISNLTNKMFQLFQNIYNDKKYNNTKFQIVSKTNSLSDVVVNYSVEVYNEQRKSTNSLLPNNYTILDKIVIYFNSFIQQKISNNIIISIIYILEGVSQHKNYEDNLELNTKNFENHLETIKNNGGYIEDQSNYGDMNYGKKTIAYSGCGIIATYNVIYFLTKDENINFPKMIQAFEKEGIIIDGLLGTSPHSIEIYLKSNGYNTINSCNKEEYDNIGENYNAFIMIIYNNKFAIMEGLHFIAITKENGYFHVHNNGYNSHKIDYNSISELLEKIDDGMAKEIFLIAIKKS